MNDHTPESSFARRKFLRRLGVIGASIPLAGGFIAAACNADPSGRRAEPPIMRTSSPTAVPVSGGATGGAVVKTAAVDYEKIDADHKKGIEDFLKNQTTPLTKGKGGSLLPYTTDGNVKVFNITADELDWETIPGKTEKARGFNAMITGPVIRATEGERVRINVKNNLVESTAVHWHGLIVPNNMDGVGVLTQPEIKPGQAFTYEFTLRNPGTHMYHAHHNSMDQVNRGLLGAFIVDPKDKTTYPKYDKEYILVLNDTMLGFTLNGKGFPATDALVAKKGERILIRWLNEGLMNHPMHLHGMPMQVFARDGWMLSQPYMCDTLDVAPGNRYDTLVEATEVGTWAFHCHILSHAENPAGFFGLTTVLVVQE